MANNTIKGLTVEIGGDTTQLGKALESVNQKSRDLSSELGQINRLLKFDPGNADLLAQKQKVLSEAVESTSEKLEKLREAERQVQAQFERGEVSEAQVRALSREIEATEQKLKGYEKAAKETADAIDDLGKETQETLQETADLNNTVSDFATKGLAGVTTLVGAAVGALTAAAESTREYRTEMGKLDTAFADNGFSVDAARGAYQELQSVLGETDQAVEAANHLAKLTDNEKDLATWTGDILPGVFATFGASLPIEGLTEAANETAKVGQVTGPLADALNWAGISEDAFNESLAKCSTEQERQALITETLAGLYGEASEAYKTTNADVIAANAANERWTASLAQVGAAVEPVLTSVKNMGAALMEQIVPVIQTLLDNLPTVAIVLAGTTAATVAFKVAAIAATAATKGMTLAQYAAAAAQKALNVVMNANPIGLIILAITGLVAAFTYLWKNNEEFRAFWIKLWDKIQKAVMNAVDYIKTLPDRIQKAISGAINRVQTWGTNMVNAAKTAVTNVLNKAEEVLKNMPSRVASAIADAINRVKKWGTDMVKTAKSAMTNVVNSAYDTLKALPGKVLSVGSDLVTGLWNGISNKVAWLKSKIKGFVDDVMDSIKDFFGVNSPSRETAWVGEMLDEGLAKGVTDAANSPIRAMQSVSAGVLDAAAGDVNGLTLGRQLSRPAVTATAPVADNSLGAKLDKILAAIERGQILTIDGDQLVGATASRYDSTLGQRRALAARGAV